mmetsp:Transcript_31136/g.52571  ORF Transcript_31136/g.52571 Transcript_31136/m.52571 type:complete len:543 (-) Transcript_31136:219-1847(-)
MSDYDELLATVEESMNIFWVLFGALLIFYMQIGFSMLEVGAVGISATKNVLMKNTFDAAVTSISWGIVGNAIAYGAPITDSDGLFLGTTGYWFELETGTDYANWFFNWAFVATAATIVSGAVAERINFRVYVGFAALLGLLTYPVIVRWGWSGSGFMSAFRENGPRLFDCGVLDFAGSGIIHLTGGVSALVSVICLGPRDGVTFVKGKKIAPEGQSDVLKVLGTLCLWFGWFAFNGVSTLAIVGSARTAARAMVMTAIAGAVGGVVSAITHSCWEKKRGFGWDHTNAAEVHLAPVLNGILGALVGITANCSTVKVEGAIIIGAVSGYLYVATEHILDHFEIDDVVSAVPVHMTGGIWGLIAGGLFTAPSYYQEAYGSKDFYTCAGIFYGGSGNQLGANIVFMLVAIPWNLATVGVLFKVCNHFGIMRVSRLVEMVGIDTMHHNDGPSKVEDVEEDDSMDMVAKGADDFGGGFGGSPEPFGVPPMTGNNPPLSSISGAFSQQPMNAFQEETKDAGTLRASVVLTEVTDTSVRTSIKANAVAPL